MTLIRPFRRVRHVHMVGIGGAGMSGIAEVLLSLGFVVSGSDLVLSEVTQRLLALGAIIFEGHRPENIAGADVVVYSSAVRPENVELRFARDQHVPLIPRSEMLAELMRLKFGIAVAGTHGKTTTTSMIGAILHRALLNPTLIVGGIVRALQSGVRMGSSDLLIVEADEFDRSFLKLSPTIAIITTLEPEHLDTYGDLAELQDAFVEFASKVPFYGSVIVCGDESNIQTIIPRIKRPIVTFGLSEDSMFRAMDIRHDRTHTRFAVTCRRWQKEFELQVPGRHNVLNALAAIALADELDVAAEVSHDALAQFTGVRRRFEIKGEVNGVIIVDDYAHHPTEVENTLRTARICWPERRLVVLFQPHLYTRTRDFAPDFGRALSIADSLLLTDIYPAREQPIPNVTSDLIAAAASEHGARDVQRLGAVTSSQPVRQWLRPGDVLIVMGAGPITRVAQELARTADANTPS